jgi:exopolysaccharide biosynthesis polyprenyl glycosylphosphotransferase
MDSLRRNHRAALPLLARSFSRMTVAADVVVCSSSGWAHGIQTDGRKVIYCHNPARWLYQSDRYEPGRGGIAGMGLSLLEDRLRRWDLAAASSAHRYLANSTVVRDRIRSAYGVDAEIVPPPYAIDVNGARSPIGSLDAGFVLCVSRLISYKNVAAVIGAMQGLGGHQLVVVGTGPQEAELRAIAPANVMMLGSVDDDQLRWLYANCAGLVSASYEDFGLTPIEAAAFGKPSALLRWGGFLDTLDEGVSGLYFDEPTPLSVAGALETMLRERWDPDAIRAHASAYSEESFTARIREIAREEVAAGGHQLPAVGVAEPPSTDTSANAVIDLRGEQAVVTRARDFSLVAASTRTQRAAPAVTALRGITTKASIAAGDLVAVSMAMLLAFVLWSRWRTADPTSFRAAHLRLGFLSLPVWFVAMAQAGLYRSRLVTSRMEELRRIARAVLLTVLGIAAISTVTRLQAARIWLVLCAILGFGALAIDRAVVRAIFRRRRRNGHMLRTVVVVGANAEAVELAHALCDDPALGYRVTGFLADDKPFGADVAGIGTVLGTIDQTLSAIRRSNATGALIATTAVPHATSMRLTSELADVGVHVELSSSLRDIATRRMTIRPVGRYPILYVEPTPRGSWRIAAKRVFDVLLASTALVVTFPVLLLAALAIKLDDPNNRVLFRQRRVGRGGASFELLKLRTMVPDAEHRLVDLMAQNDASWPLFKMRNDPRVTRVGRFLRRSSIDELPQLWNVLRGDMSIVGPRPALASEMTQWTPDMHARLKVRPGITGMWQVNGRSAATSAEYERLDVYYVNNWSLLTDLAIIARTVPAVFATRGAF